MQKLQNPGPAPYWLLWTYSPRERIVKLIEIVYWLLIFEGVFRKWLLPFLSKPLYFIRDPFVLIIYYLAWKHHLFPRKNILFRAFLVCLVLFTILVGLQAYTDQNALATGLYGLRMYFFNIPFAFLCMTLMTGADLKRIGRRTLVVGIPMAVLTFLQYISPVSSPINRLPDGGDGYAIGDTARASGTFTFTAGHAMFAHVLFCFCLSNWLLPAKSRFLQGRLLWPATIGSFINVVLDGNRTIFLNVMITFAFASVFRIFIQGMRFNLRSIAPEIFMVIGAVIYMTVFGNAYSNMRDKVSSNSDEGNSRLLSAITSIGYGLQKSYVLGTGIGAGTQGGKSLASIQSRQSRALGVDEEVEMSRLLQEAGPLGLLYVGYRYVMAYVLIVESFKASRRTRNPLPLIICCFPAMNMIFGQITLNGISNGFAWIFVGFALAATRLGQNQNRT